MMRRGKGGGGTMMRRGKEGGGGSRFSVGACLCKSGEAGSVHLLPLLQGRS